MQKKEAYCASWIVPVISPPMRDSALIVENGWITAILPIHELPDHSKNLRILDFPNSVIVPAWVNAHTHLELSYLNNEPWAPANFLDWVERLLHLRAEKETPQLVEQAALQQMQQMRKNGTALIGDITNGSLLSILPAEPLERVVFYEILGFLPEKAETILQNALQTVQKKNPQAILTPHAPYSTSARLLQQLKQVSPRITIHLAESKEEFAFFLEHSKAMEQFLKKRQAWSQNWRTPGKTPVQYLQELNLLNEQTLIVHGVQVTDQDVQILKQTGSSVCLCLRSNERLNVGLPPIEKYLQARIPLCLGTDSLASNTSLDLNEEISYLWEHFNPVLDARQVVQMATLNGARALGRQQTYGSLTVGKKAAFNVFEFERPVVKNPEQAVVSRNWRRVTCF